LSAVPVAEGLEIRLLLVEESEHNVVMVTSVSAGLSANVTSPIGVSGAGFALSHYQTKIVKMFGRSQCSVDTEV
jgi:hypothetical protein